MTSLKLLYLVEPVERDESNVTIFGAIFYITSFALARLVIYSGGDVTQKKTSIFLLGAT